MSTPCCGGCWDWDEEDDAPPALDSDEERLGGKTRPPAPAVGRRPALARAAVMAAWLAGPDPRRKTGWRWTRRSRP